MSSTSYRIKYMNHLRKHKIPILSGIALLFLLLIVTLSGKVAEQVEKVAHTEVVTKILDTIKIPHQKPTLIQYVSVTGSCGASYEGECVNVRSGPSIASPLVFRARNGVVLRVKDTVSRDGREWYKLSFDEWLRYPERVEGDMYISKEYVTPFLDEGNKEITATTSKTTKRITVDRGEQMLYAYDGEVLFMKEKVSTGIKATPTPRGTFTVFKKTPSRYMQGPIPGISDHYYDLPGVPWNLYFTEQGAVIHGAYWHNNFGKAWSNGCVNLPIASAEKLYKWADVGTTVLVRD